MNLRRFLPLVLAFGLAAESLPAASPVVSNVRSSQRPGTKLVDIYYDVSDADGGTVMVEVNVSGDGGLSYLIPATALSGHVGAGVALGSNRHIIWNAGTDWNGNYIANTKVRVTAYDGTIPSAPNGMVYIQAGPFQMGDNLDGMSNAPVWNVDVSAFYMDKHEVSKEKYAEVYGWAVVNGYALSAGSAKTTFHPIQTVEWCDSVKWCNARSEKEGLTPCYYTDSAQTTVYRSGNVSITNSMVNWNANGYRLPTEAEWEKAARGGVTGDRYPWGNAISYSNANYFGHPTYAGDDPDTSPMGAFPANGFGLHDVAGNVWEWCWDIYGDYGADNTDPHGPTSGSFRILRGGAWNSDISFCRVAYRKYVYPFYVQYVYPSPTDNSIGFRTVRR